MQPEQVVKTIIAGLDAAFPKRMWPLWMVGYALATNIHAGTVPDEPERLADMALHEMGDYMGTPEDVVSVLLHISECRKQIGEEMDRYLRAKHGEIPQPRA